MDMSDPPLVPRPRPPRSKSSRMASSQTSSKGTVTSMNVLDALSLQEVSKPSTSAHPLVLIGALETLTPPATPPLAMTPVLEPLIPSNRLNEFCQQSLGILEREDIVAEGSTTQVQREHSGKNIQDAGKLEHLLAEAREIIEKRERELGIAASIGKSLLDSNIALRAKQEALLRRVREHTHLLDEDSANVTLSPAASPSSRKGKERAEQPPIMPFQSLHIPNALGAYGELVEGRPPPSPRPSLGRSTLRASIDARGDISSLFTHRRSASNGSTSSLPSISSVTSPPRGDKTQSMASPLRRSQAHRRQSSSSSALGYLESASGLKSMSRSSSTKSIAELHYANAAQQRHLSEEIQRLQLSEQNAELERRLQELEFEATRADVTGRKKLRRLDKELMGLKKELESALERNRELEDKLDRRSGGKNAALRRFEQIRPSFSLPEVRIRTESANSEHSRPSDSMLPVHNSSIPTDTDVDAEFADATEVPGASSNDYIAGSLNSSDQSEVISAAVVNEDSAAAGSIVSLLLAKINELQEANLQISARKESLNEELLAASSQFEDMRRKYEFLEERVIEAEIRNHRILELEDGDPISEDALLAIQWPQHDALSRVHPDSISPATKLKRKAVGNRPRIEQYRRLSSLYGSQAGSEYLLEPTSSSSPPPRKGILGPSNSRNVSPLRDKFNPAEEICTSKLMDACLSVSPARSSSSKARSRAGSFFDTDVAQDSHNAAHDHASCNIRPIGNTSATQAVDMSLFTDNVFVAGPSFAHALEGAGISMGDHDAASGKPLHNQLEQIQTQLSMSRSTSAVSLYKGHPSRSAEEQGEEEDYLGDLLPGGPADAQAFDDLQSTLQDLAVRWEDDVTVARIGQLKLISSRDTSQSARGATLPWTYEDGDSDNSDNDPWKDDSGDRQAIESVEQLLARDKAEARGSKRRRRLEELARQMLDDEDADLGAGIQDRLALVRLDSNESDSLHHTVVRRESRASEDDLEYEEVKTTQRTGEKGTDYWPVAFKARYAPNVVAMRVQKTSQEYLGLCLLWTKFLVVLAVAVVFSIWRGPEAGLGVRRRSRKRLGRSDAGKSDKLVVVRKARTPGSEHGDELPPH